MNTYRLSFAKYLSALLFMCTLGFSNVITAQVKADPSVIPVSKKVLTSDSTDQLKVVVSVKDEETKEALANVQVRVFDGETGDLEFAGTTDEYGYMTAFVPFEGSYRVETCDPRYLTRGATIDNCGNPKDDLVMCVTGFNFFTYEDGVKDTEGVRRPVTHLLTADFELKSIKVGKIVPLENIYYDFDKATLREESKRELDLLVRGLKQLPGLDLEIRSHTDSRGTAEYNQNLSQRRAQSVVDYLIRNGIERNRFEATGFGESVPVNECVDGVKCSEAQHQKNRRTEFEIKAYDPEPCPDLPFVGRKP